MKLWHLHSQPPLRKFSFTGSWKMGIFQLWCGTHIWQLILTRAEREAQALVEKEERERFAPPPARRENQGAERE